MGNKPLDSNLHYYSHSHHPIEGKVAVYAQAEEGTYVMTKQASKEGEKIELIENIGRTRSPYLVSYYGKESKPKVFAMCHQEPARGRSSNTIMYWEFLNYDLTNLIQSSKATSGGRISEETLISLLERITQAAVQLAKFGVYPDIKPKLIQFTSARDPKLYWEGIEPKNMHRPYYLYFYMGDYVRSFYSPEELYSLKINHIVPNLNLQKCVVFSLGVTILEAATGLNCRGIYSLETFQMSHKVKDEFLRSMVPFYSRDLVDLVAKMLNRMPENRPTYQDIIFFCEMCIKQEVQTKDSRAHSDKISMRS